MTYQINQLAGTVTLTASATGYIQPVLSNTPFDKLCVEIVPDALNTPYTVNFYFSGRLVESHNYPDPNGSYICLMNYPDFSWPANLSTHSIPRHFDPDRRDFKGILYLLEIINRAAVPKVFEVYTLYNTYGHTFSIINQE